MLSSGTSTSSPSTTAITASRARDRCGPEAISAAIASTLDRAAAQREQAAWTPLDEDDDPEPVERDRQRVPEVDLAGHPARARHLAVGRAEDRAHRLLQDHAEAPGHQQRLERSAVEEADQAALEQHAQRAGEQEGD